MLLTRLIFLYLLALALLSTPTHAASLTATDLQVLASTTAIQAGVDPVAFTDTIGCESAWNPDAIGDNGSSYGLVQLHNPETAWGISTTTALNPLVSMDIMAKAWQKGEASKWSCYTKTRSVH